MSKNRGSALLWIIISVVILATIGAGAFIIYTLSGKNIPISTQDLTAGLKNLVKKEAKIYTDESGFSFKYPGEYQVSDKTPTDDTTYYSLLEVTRPGKEEKITIKVKDSKYKKTEDWLKSDKEAQKDYQLDGAVSLGSIPANQYGYSVSGKKFTTTLAIEKGILYQITSPITSPDWEETYNSIVSSLTFVDPNDKPSTTTSEGSSGQSNSGSSGESGAESEPEEVVE